MATLTDIDWDVVIDLDFEPPCGMTHDGRPCDKTAEWWSVFAAHCNLLPFDELLCADHYRYIVNGGLGHCTSCKRHVIMRDYVLQLERLKP